MAMARGTIPIRGSFTAYSQTGNVYTIEIGKTLSKYIFYIWMTDASRAALMATGQTSAKMYECLGKYPASEALAQPGTNNAFISYRIVPSTSAISVSSSDSGTLTPNRITLTANALSGGANILYRDYTYEYVIIPLED